MSVPREIPKSFAACDWFWLRDKDDPEVIAHIRQIECVGLEILSILRSAEALRMSTPIGPHELLFFGRREVTNFNNDVDMIGGDRR